LDKISSSLGKEEEKIDIKSFPFKKEDLGGKG
jgi:hypothetical protein